MTHLTLTKATALTGLLLMAAIFGFFYAYVCSAMWGLDRVPAPVAIEAMQGINAAVRNATFMPSFFLTPVVAGLAAALAWRLDRGAGLWFAAGACIYLVGGLLLTAAFNIPMNEALAEITPPQDLPEAEAIWRAFSPEWQTYNLWRTIASGLGVLAMGVGLIRLGRVAPMTAAVA